MWLWRDLLTGSSCSSITAAAGALEAQHSSFWLLGLTMQLPLCGPCGVRKDREGLMKCLGYRSKRWRVSWLPPCGPHGPWESNCSQPGLVPYWGLAQGKIWRPEKAKGHVKEALLAQAGLRRELSLDSSFSHHCPCSPRSWDGL